MNYNNICYSCFCEKPIADSPCPKCGYKYAPENVPQNCLLPGTVLKNRYVVGIALGVGGFGITYKCIDMKIGGICAIKEYFPSRLAMRTHISKYVTVAPEKRERFNKIMSRFVNEAEMVKKLKHRNIVTIYDNFFENNTAYYAMEYCDGIDLRRYTNNFSRQLGYDEGMNLLYQVMSGLEYIHSKGILHRDIAPDNIYITKNNTVKILDFGSARREMDQENRELSAIVKVGYAPIEQYGGSGKQGPYTDIYALGATFYHLFTSRIPMESTQRVSNDNMLKLSQLRPDLPYNLKFCIERAMAIKPSQRIANIAEMKSILGVGKRKTEPNKNVAKPVENNVIRDNITTNNHTNNQPNIPKQPRKKQTTHNSNVRVSISRRMVAYMIDLLIWGLIYNGSLFGIIGINNISFGLSMMFPLIFMLINAFSEISASTTIGKSVLGMYVRGKTDYAAQPGQIFLRNIVKMLGVFVVIFAKGNDLLEDDVTDTIVCMKK